MDSLVKMCAEESVRLAVSRLRAPDNDRERPVEIVCPVCLGAGWPKSANSFTFGAPVEPCDFCCGQGRVKG